ncbi:MAG: DNA repair protein RadC [Oleiphilaceae bacterium]|nr:DNA repair protein RadC [Oleiphilaceae bacterium]
MAIKDWPATERPREKLLQHGSAHLSDAELLAIFLRVGMKGKSAIDLAREVLVHFGSLKALLAAPLVEFSQVNGLGPAKFVQLQASLEMSKRYFHQEMRETSFIDSPTASKQYVLRALGQRQHETFACLFLDNQHGILCFEELFQGTIDGASVYPREVVKRVLALGAAAVVFCHNHPSGSTQPSQADCQLTERLKQALELIDVRVLDHLIVAGDQVISFAERGLI